MEKPAIKSAIMSCISSELDLWLDEMNDCVDGYDFEDKLLQRCRKINKMIISKSVGKVPKSRNKKNC